MEAVEANKLSMLDKYMLHLARSAKVKSKRRKKIIAKVIVKCARLLRKGFVEWLERLKGRLA